MLRLFRGNCVVTALHKKATNGYFHAYEASQSLHGNEMRMRQGIGSVVGDKVFITWMNDFGNIWQDVRDLSDCKIHTTLSE